ncbi:hypothetical protein ACFFU8_08855 [Chromobacterium piscinae]|uniref:hypothetical protein n=1 Tax=Chromobacterium piscinae TaxID=686831 RepID=UPI001E2D5B27|nr:hypothetical protein [Chromobacterium piscinae]MCD5327987.1 hypothetical protein [Chromobacterium piscinae]
MASDEVIGDLLHWLSALQGDEQLLQLARYRAKDDQAVQELETLMRYLHACRSDIQELLELLEADPSGGADDLDELLDLLCSEVAMIGQRIRDGLAQVSRRGVRMER